MSARVIDGRAVAAKLREEYRGRIAKMRSGRGITPGLAVILVGEDPASQVYVRNKIRDCAEVGIHSTLIELPASTAEAELLSRIDALNADDSVHGILIQLPLPKHVEIRKVLERISVDKDVDGFHLYNVGGLVTGHQVFPPCTPYGVQKLLEHEGIGLDGRNVVVVGASNIVGKPTAMMLMQKDATVSICHKKTRDLAQYTLLADILVVAAGVPGLIIPQMVRTGAVVIDVGINRLPDGRIVGDVDFEGVRRKASFISPVPGGVGPMTRAMLLHNTLLSAERRPERCQRGNVGITRRDALTA
ncbi:MAG TPA: bifunctional methylenetetrahydrofolate dehydrogenase/methenyltetrahydrofolate cyclohydrolase FolD [Steroidobacteraceae bacterium]|jgi:methylenetetrahydrofolate dehydrogenase (NADP+)/methenyltetrahydrofolate cyclohydrolase|nr:bifunctional methylenetetrahydrofolate dehydrogenase/methenyltetrahydrofolate cyclohydrolase FolD [Steroidobacteraceae bacterium]